MFTHLHTLCCLDSLFGEPVVVTQHQTRESSLAISVITLVLATRNSDIVALGCQKA